LKDEGEDDDDLINMAMDWIEAMMYHFRRSIDGCGGVDNLSVLLF